MASNLIAMAFNPMASNLKRWPRTYTSDGLQPNSDGLQPNSDGRQPNSKGIQPNSDGLQPKSDCHQTNIAMVSNLTAMPSLNY